MRTLLVTYLCVLVPIIIYFTDKSINQVDDKQAQLRAVEDRLERLNKQYGWIKLQLQLPLL